jgi:pimeloyl-ACP methyl ester carboxylesterase
MPMDRFEHWAETYLATDAESGQLEPPSVAVPAGPDADLADSWNGRLPYDPSLIRCPTLIVRGEWDAVCRDKDAARLVEAMTRASTVRDVKLARGAHRMHLETNRQALFAAVGGFLLEQSQ